MTKNATVSWELPVVREQGGDLDPTDIEGIEISLAIVGGGFRVLETVPPTKLNHFIPELEIGDWEFRLVVIDIVGRRSADVEVPFTVKDDSPPGIVTNSAVKLS